MSRYRDEYAGDYDPRAAALWDASCRRAIASPRGQRTLRGLRAALYALPARRLVKWTTCTVGGADVRTPLMTDAEAAEAAKYAYPASFDAPWWATLSPLQRACEHEWIADLIAEDGEGVCAVGAHAWHQLVLAGTDPDVAFMMLPTFGTGPAPGEAWNADEERMGRTAALGEQHGIARTLAWELACRNDMRYELFDPPARWAAFVEWLNVATGDHPYPELLIPEVPL